MPYCLYRVLSLAQLEKPAEFDAFKNVPHPAPPGDDEVGPMDAAIHRLRREQVAPQPQAVMRLDDQRLLVQAVQRNCHIADAAQAADMTLCIYLLQMRELFRWEQGAAPMKNLDSEALGAWLAEREALWNRLDGMPWQPLPVADHALDPFDVAAINAALQPQGLVYGAGFTGPGRASFFLAELTAVQQRDGMLLLVSGCEYARCLASPPAMLAGHTIYLRQASLQRWLWEKYEAWTFRRPNGAFKAALDAHGFELDGPRAVERMAQAQSETLILHELGEVRAGALLGPTWQDMRSALACRRTELHARAVRDLLADCLLTLPTLLERQADASLHFWFANFDGLRAVLFPRLNQAYSAWCAGDGKQTLWDALALGAAHWQQVCEKVLALHQAHGEGAQPHIKALLDSPAGVLG